MMNATLSEESITSRTLEELDRRFPKFKDEETHLDNLLDTMVHFQPLISSSYHNSSETNQTEEADELPDDSEPTEKIAQYTASLLHQIADAAVEKIRVLESSELRSILHHFVALPFPVDDLVAVAEEEIHRRQAALDGHNTANTRLFESLKRIPPGMMKKLVGGDKDHPSKAIKKMLRNLAKDKKEKHDDDAEESDVADETHNRPTSLEDIIEILAAAAEVRDNEVDFPIEKTDRVEYGRIQELIDQYRRIDFASGARRSRFNQEGQRLMAKRMMSRLLP
eukprot:scaffold6007_cov183-Amphora_coffeaeformis.AAC.10